MESNQIGEGMALLWDYFEKKPNKSQFTVWFEEFKEYDIEEFKQGIIKYLRSTKNAFFPMPSEVKDHMACNGLPSAEIAWSEILLCDKKSVSFGKVSLDLPITNPVSLSIYGGLEYSARKDFIANYNAVIHGGNASSVIESHNKSIGDEVERLGDKLNKIDDYIEKLPTIDDRQIAIDAYDEGHCQIANNGGFPFHGEKTLQSPLDPECPNSGFIRYREDIRELYIEILEEEKDGIVSSILKGNGYIFKKENKRIVSQGQTAMLSEYF
jgi:hypothetical protein